MSLYSEWHEKLEKNRETAPTKHLSTTISVPRQKPTGAYWKAATLRSAASFQSLLRPIRWTMSLLWDFWMA